MTKPDKISVDSSSPNTVAGPIVHTLELSFVTSTHK